MRHHPRRPGATREHTDDTREGAHEHNVKAQDIEYATRRPGYQWLQHNAFGFRVRRSRAYKYSDAERMLLRWGS